MARKLRHLLEQVPAKKLPRSDTPPEKLVVVDGRSFTKDEFNRVVDELAKIHPRPSRRTKRR